jgi:multiple sugar transport system substrate-binding protein
MLKIATDFEKAKNVELDISFTIQEDLLKKIIGAFAARRVPDVAFCFSNDWEVVPKYAWEGRLADCSDVINELRPRYIEKFLQAAYVHDNTVEKRSYFGVPIEAQTMHSHYWRDLLKEAGMADEPDKIPLKRDEHWAYWKKAQDALRKKDPAKYGKLYGIGMTESPRASDTIYNFEMALLSFGGQLISDDGKVIADQPRSREAIVKTLQWFVDLFNSGYVPPDALNWSDGDNNANFHSKSVVMTPNPSLSIPAHHFFNAPDNKGPTGAGSRPSRMWPPTPSSPRGRPARAGRWATTSPWPRGSTWSGPPRCSTTGGTRPTPRCTRRTGGARP